MELQLTRFGPRQNRVWGKYSSGRPSAQGRNRWGL
jgi:hypothetical protein